MSIVAQHTLSELFRQYESDYLCDRARSTRYQLQRFLAQVLRDLGDLPLSELTPDALRELKRRLSATRKPGTVHKYLSRLDTVLKIAVEDYEWLAVNPMKKVKRPTASAGVVRYLDAQELPRLLDAARHSRNKLLYPLVVLALGTGGRRGELLGLRWEEVDIQGGVVYFLRTKTNHSRRVPLLGEARAILGQLAQVREPGVPWVFRNPSGARTRVMHTSWDKAKQRAGLKDFRFHDLRHTFASYMAMSGASLRDIAEVLGHRNIQQTMMYAHLAHSHVDSVVERMHEAFLNKTAQEDNAHA
jgi:integrase